MPGLDNDILKLFNPKRTLGRVSTDVQSDFILAPHYSGIYVHSGEDLYQIVKELLSSGRYEPELPITIEVPKRNGLTRPGAILGPLDRFVYQAIIDIIAQAGESQLDRSQVFSNVLLKRDPQNVMFEASNLTWRKFNQKVTKYCKDPNLPYAIKADIANFFERLYQHTLINLLHAAGCAPKAVNILEKLLLAWMEKDSHGILQGMFPSDFLGNFYLCGLDSELTDRGIPSVRFVDDLYLFFPSSDSARLGLVDLCRALRNDGLHLNESKTFLVESEKLLREESELDRMFEDARREIEGTLEIQEIYGFVHIWNPERDEELSEEDVELNAMESLYGEIDAVGERQAEKIERFCLPIFAAAGSSLAVKKALEGIIIRPHLTQLYCSYLVRMIASYPEIGKGLEKYILEDKLPYDWQMMWCVATLIEANTVSTSTISMLFKVLRNSSRSVALRGLCGILIGKHAPPARRHNLRNHYSDESAPYVRASLLFASRYFPKAERKTCQRTWGPHTPINSLIAKVVSSIS
jgi:hypothetical protein